MGRKKRADTLPRAKQQGKIHTGIVVEAVLRILREEGVRDPELYIIGGRADVVMRVPGRIIDPYRSDVDLVCIPPTEWDDETIRAVEEKMRDATDQRGADFYFAVLSEEVEDLRRGISEKSLAVHLPLSASEWTKKR